MADPRPWDTHSVLLSKLKSFDEKSAWELVDGHFRAPLEAFASRSGLNRSEVQDAVQETLLTFARLHRADGYDRSKGRLRAWLFGIAKNEIASTLRSRARHEQKQEQGVSQLVAQDLEEAWHEEWERHSLQRCLKRVQAEVLPKTYEIFVALLESGASAAKVAARHGVAITVVYNAKSRVSKRLQELVQELEDE